MINIGAFLELEKDYETVKNIRIAMGSVGPITYRAKVTEQKLKAMKLGDEFFDTAAAGVANEATPIDDVRASAYYRNKVIGVLTKRALKECVARIGNKEAKA